MKNGKPIWEVKDEWKLFDRAYAKLIYAMLFETKVSERTLCGALMIELHEALKDKEYSEYFVDVEYNRNFGGALKKICREGNSS